MTKGSLAQLLHFLNTYQAELKPPFADYGGNEELGASIMRRALASGGETDYTVIDKTTGYDLLKPVGKTFSTGICMDLLEHTSNPFIVAKNIQGSLEVGALLFVTVPMVWEVHYPPDYWRFTAYGLRELFKDMEPIRVYAVHDHADDEEVPRERIVGIFRKI